MRKYQQLLLLIISIVSVAVLLMYKSENNRLKDVLHVINFFGRSDVALVERLENNGLFPYFNDYSRPFGVWQTLSKNFHAYSSYWTDNEFPTGGEAMSLVVGRKGAVLNFKCIINYETGKTSAKSKFRFQRIDKPNEDELSSFTRYIFYCRIIMQHYGQPISVTFIDLTDEDAVQKGGYTLKLRPVKSPDAEKRQLQPMTVCVQLYNHKLFNTTIDMTQYRHAVQFFMHHYTLGIEDFIIYDADELSSSISSNLSHINIRLHLLPFNFPFLLGIHDVERIHYIIETDCLLRNLNRARYTILLKMNELFYPATKLDNEKSMLKSLKNYSHQITRFELPLFIVCKNQGHTFLMDNNLYDPEARLTYKIFVYRLAANSVLSTNMDDITDAVTSTRSILLPPSRAFVHHYDNCNTVGKDGLHDWRTSLRGEFMITLQRIKEELKGYV